MNQSVTKPEHVREGTLLVTDDGFTCMRDHELKIVKAEADGSLYVECDDGHHGLDGQECSAGEHEVDFDHYIGFWLQGEEPPHEAISRVDLFKKLLRDGLEQGEVLVALHDADPEVLNHDGTIEAARSNYCDDDCEIDDKPLLSVGDGGVWVSAWVWVTIDQDDVEEPEMGGALAEAEAQTELEISTAASDARRGEPTDDLGESPDY